MKPVAAALPPMPLDLVETARAIQQAGRHLDELGYAPGGSGNISMRVGDQILITPGGSSLGTLDERALSVTTLTGHHLAGPVPSKESNVHAAVYRSRPDVHAVVHLHSAHATAVACQQAADPASAIPALTPYFVMRVGQVPLMKFAPPGSPELAESISALPATTAAALMAHHGSVCLGPTLEAAVAIATEVEVTARVHLLSMVGNQVQLNSVQIAAIADRHPVNWISHPEV